MSNPDDPARAPLRLAWAREQLRDASATLARASTDAGFRSYWRSEGAGPSRIVMDAPPGMDDVRHWLRVRSLLMQGGVRVPAVFAEDVEAGLLLLEDLGGPTMAQSIDDDSADAAIDAAIGQLLRLQAVALPEWVVGFDAALLARDAGLFEEWFLGRHLAIDLGAGERGALAGVQARLADNLLGQAQVPVHRDFMLRNLMPVEGGPAVLDFQDLVRGPIAYDPVSLVRDAFLSWPEAQVRQWLSRYHARAAAAGLPVPELDTFRRDADWCGVQRHLKILGVFARLHHRDGKPRYLADAPRFIGYLDAVLPLHPQLAPLQALLVRTVKPALASKAGA